MNEAERYHGWLIELVSEPTGYSFRCWIPEEWIAVSDRKIYPTVEQALKVAKVYADLEAVRWTLLRFLNEVYQRCNLSPDEHLALACSVVEFVMSMSKKSHQKCRKEAPTQKTKIRPEFDVMSGGGIATQIKSVASLICSHLW